MFFLSIKGWANFKLTTPVHKKTRLDETRRMVVASYCETLKFLSNMNFNIPLYDTLLYGTPKTNI